MGKDFFRDTWIRYLGYANEVGEALRPMIDVKFVRYSYGVAFGYILADTVDKALAKMASDGRPSKVLWATGDALIWQSLASIILPGWAINRIVYYSNKHIEQRFPKIPHQKRALFTVGLGLLAIPIIVTPIDTAVNAFMGLTYRKIFG